MSPVSLDPTQTTSLVEQIVSSIAASVQEKSLRPGMRLPSIRQFADTHRISKFTVVEAYDRLVAQGYLVSRRGAGFFVASKLQPIPQIERESPLDRVVDSLWLIRQGLQADDDTIKAGSGWLPASWMDEDGLARSLRDLSRKPNARLTEYGNPMGYLPLRKLLQLKLSEVEIEAKPQQIVLTAGASQALDLIHRYLLQRGDYVMVDDPAYSNLFANLKLHGVNILSVPRTSTGPDLEIMEELASTWRPKLYFTMSVLHNPTGASFSAATAFRILQLAERCNFLIVEDDIYGDFQVGPGQRLAALDQLNRVIYVSSFSKTLSANLRVGYIAASEALCADLCDLKLLTGLSTSETTERIIHGLLSDGHYRKHLERTRGRIHAAHATLRPRLEKLGIDVWGNTDAGLFLWGHLPGVTDTGPVASAAMKNGILLAAGNIFRPHMEPSPCMRFNVALSNNDKVFSFLAETLNNNKA